MDTITSDPSRRPHSDAYDGGHCRVGLVVPQKVGGRFLPRRHPKCDGPGKLTLKGREALTAIIEGNIPKVQTWLDTIEREDGAKAALDAYTKLIEFGIPKQARHELSSDQAAEVIVRLAGEYRPVIHDLGVIEAEAQVCSETTYLSDNHNG